MQQGVRLAASPDRHQQSIGDELRRHLRLNRPADDAAREPVDDGGDVEPALRGPDIGEVGDPFAVRLIGFELPVERVRRHGGDRPFVLARDVNPLICALVSPLTLNGCQEELTA